MSKTLTNLMLGTSLAVFSVTAPAQLTLAQIDHGQHDHHHPMIGIDHLQVLDSGDYAGLPNPNYNRLSYIFPHIHTADVSTSHFHAIGTYSYTGDPTNSTVIPTSTNNRIPETRFPDIPPVSLLPGTGVFANKLVSTKTDDNMYSNLKMAPIDHLIPYLDDPLVNIWYNSSNQRWTGSIGDAKLALELVSITPGLGVANSEGVDLFDSVGDTYFIGEGDTFSFTPTYYTDKSAKSGKYSAELRLVDINTAEGYTALLPSGTFAIDFQAVPESSTVTGLGLFGLLALLVKRKAQVN